MGALFRLGTRLEKKNYPQECGARTTGVVLGFLDNTRYNKRTIITGSVVSVSGSVFLVGQDER